MQLHYLTHVRTFECVPKAKLETLNRRGELYEYDKPALRSICLIFVEISLFESYKICSRRILRHRSDPCRFADLALHVNSCVRTVTVSRWFRSGANGWMEGTSLFSEAVRH
jgi:hypothetical protein